MQGFNLFMCTKRPLHSADSLTFLHCCIRLAKSLCVPPRPPFSVFFADDTLLWQVSHKFLSLHPVLSVSPAHLRLSPSFSGVTPVWHYCLHSVPICLPLPPPSPPTETVRPFLCPPSCLYPAWCFSDATEVVWTSVSFFFSPCISIGCRSLPCWCFPIRVAPEVKKLYVST